ncbi:MAG: ribbon-helix-helix domain-containing protein [Aquificae bacterium]|nr:ribbon-helix-helix domain-containing protein [Aquificota bacterium]
MSVKSRKVSITMEQELFDAIKEVARSRGESLSSVIEEYIELGMNLAEDIGLSKIGEERLSTLDKDKTLTHEEVWD